MMTDYLFNGYYGYRNTGDDVFCVVADWGSRKYWGAKKLSFVAKELPVLNSPAKAIIPTVKRYPGQQTISQLMSSLKAGHMVYFGGSTLHSDQELWVNIFRNLKKLPGVCKTIGAAGVSVGPFSTSRAENEIRKLIGEMCFISVRDKMSFDIVKGMNLDTKLIRSFDPALMMLDVMQDRSKIIAPIDKDNRLTIGISVCNYERYVNGDRNNESKRVGFLKSVVRKLASEGFRINFYVFNGNNQSGDDLVTEEIISALGDYPYVKKIPYNDDPCDVFDSISRCNAVFGVRLHSAILAYAANIPFVLVEYHRKCTDFLDEIEYQNDIRVSDAQGDPNEVALLLAGLANGYSNAPWKKNVDESRELSRLNFTQAPYFCV